MRHRHIRIYTYIYIYMYIYKGKEPQTTIFKLWRYISISHSLSHSLSVSLSLYLSFFLSHYLCLSRSLSLSIYSKRGRQKKKYWDWYVYIYIYGIHQYVCMQKKKSLRNSSVYFQLFRYVPFSHLLFFGGPWSLQFCFRRLHFYYLIRVFSMIGNMGTRAWTLYRLKNGVHMNVCTFFYRLWVQVFGFRSRCRFVAH